MIYTVTVARVGWGQLSSCFYTTDNGSWRDLMRLKPKTHARGMLQKDARIGDLAFNRADKIALGHPPVQRCLHAGPDDGAVPRMGAASYSWPYGTVVYDLDVSPDGTRVSASFGEVTGKQDVRVMADAAALDRGDPDAGRPVRLRPSVPNELRLLARREVPLRQRVLQRRLEHLPVRTRRRERWKRSATPRPASSGRCRSATTS